MFTEKELREIISNWDVQQNLPILNVYTMDGSKDSRNVWAIGGDYILKTDSRERVLMNLKVTKALAAQGFMAATPVPTKSGEEYLDKEHIVVLTRGIKGSPLSKADRFSERRFEFAACRGFQEVFYSVIKNYDCSILF